MDGAPERFWLVEKNRDCKSKGKSNDRSRSLRDDNKRSKNKVRAEQE
jgi:hypothetical protein